MAERAQREVFRQLIGRSYHQDARNIRGKGNSHRASGCMGFSTDENSGIGAAFEAEHNEFWRGSEYLYRFEIFQKNCCLWVRRQGDDQCEAGARAHEEILEGYFR